MVVYVLSRSRFDLMLEENGINENNVELYKDAMFISILDTSGVPAGRFHIPVFKESHSNVLTVSFDDVVNEQGDARRLDLEGNAFIQKGRSITKKQSKQIADFIKRHLDKKYAFVHCAAGISRSGAVGSFIAEKAGMPYDQFKMLNPYVYENSMVLKLIKESYG